WLWSAAPTARATACACPGPGRRTASAVWGERRRGTPPRGRRGARAGPGRRIAARAGRSPREQGRRARGRGDDLRRGDRPHLSRPQPGAFVGRHARARDGRAAMSILAHAITVAPRARVAVLGLRGRPLEWLESAGLGMWGT